MAFLEGISKSHSRRSRYFFRSAFALQKKPELTGFCNVEDNAVRSCRLQFHLPSVRVSCSSQSEIRKYREQRRNPDSRRSRYFFRPAFALQKKLELTGFCTVEDNAVSSCRHQFDPRRQFDFPAIFEGYLLDQSLSFF